MRFTEIAEFIATKMRMSHIYQPVMLMELLRNGGTATDEQIAKAILAHDPVQAEYYRTITNNMVGRVLKQHGLVTKANGTYQLAGFESFTGEERQKLLDLSQARLDAYLEKYGQRAFEHRKMSNGYLSGTLRYEVLKRASFHCELCGIAADDKALEVDHILPRNKGGSDDPSNLQALCYSCNAMKRDRDDTDFRAIRESYGHREDGCLFCHPPKERLVAQNELAYAIRDGFPVTPLHTLIIPRRHVADYFGLSDSELKACHRLIHEQREAIQAEDPSVAGFNIGANAGLAAGQTIFHAHIHLIPRRVGDVAEPRGGVRHTIPGKGAY